MKSVKKLIKFIKKLPKNIVKSMMKDIKKTFAKPFFRVSKWVVRVFKLFNDSFMNIIKKIVKGFTFIFFYIKCVLKMGKNFYFCSIYYILDIVKYILIYLPIFSVLLVIGMSKEWIRMKPFLDKILSWPNGTLNDCYRCKNKKGGKFLNNIKSTVSGMMESNSADDSCFSFFFFLLILSVASGFGYTFWRSVLKTV